MAPLHFRVRAWAGVVCGAQWVIPPIVRRGVPRKRGVPRVAVDQVFVFAGGELPTPFLRACGVEIETKFGEP